MVTSELKFFFAFIDSAVSETSASFRNDSNELVLFYVLQQNNSLYISFCSQTKMTRSRTCSSSLLRVSQLSVLFTLPQLLIGLHMSHGSQPNYS